MTWVQFIHQYTTICVMFGVAFLICIAILILIIIMLVDITNKLQKLTKKG